MDHEPTISEMLRELGCYYRDPNVFENTDIDIIKCLYRLLTKIKELETRIEEVEEVANRVPLDPQD